MARLIHLQLPRTAGDIEVGRQRPRCRGSRPLLELLIPGKALINGTKNSRL